ncbi:MAG: tetratricopeptide repeat protein [Alphaproteobacteria bacterium]|nr:tetratricopeptide repeat protein [Alphaproteobacteria bacterium]
MIQDFQGNPVSTDSVSAVAGLNRVILMVHAYQADPLAALDRLLADQPDFVMAHAVRAGLLATAMDRAFEGELKRSVAALEGLVAKANERERGHIAAVRAWLAGDFERAVEHWGRVAIDHPRDGMAVQFAHLGDFYLGYSHMLRDRMARVVSQWSPHVPGYGYVLGMSAFGLEEAGDYARAEDVGRKAYALNANDGWAAHAVAHVYEMRGDSEAGIRWLESTAKGWAPNSMFAFHNWWHLALYYLDRHEVGRALALYDERIAGGLGQALELVDSTAMLWRLATLGESVGDRWAVVAERWAERIDQRLYAFNDVHAMMAFIGAGRTEDQARVIAALDRAAGSGGTNAMMSREVGLPAARGLAAFAASDYPAALEALLPLRGKANRFGGSHAQRDLFSWTTVEAAIRSGNRAMAEALLHERLASKPASAVNVGWRRRLAALGSKAAA